VFLGSTAASINDFELPVSAHSHPITANYLGFRVGDESPDIELLPSRFEPSRVENYLLFLSIDVAELMRSSKNFFHRGLRIASVAGKMFSLKLASFSLSRFVFSSRFVLFLRNSLPRSMIGNLQTSLTFPFFSPG
jgi:hypothetical protein